MTDRDLHREVCLLPGVASAEVTPQAGAPPIVRVWTDGTRPDGEVRRAVEELVSAELPLREDVSRRRTGLGRSLVDMLPAALAEPDPSHLATESDVERRPGRLAKLAIEETIDGVGVRAIDNDGNEAEETVRSEADGLTNAVANAVARLRGFPTPRRAVVNTREVDDTTVVTVLVEMPSGSKAAGAAIVSGGLPFTVGCAVDSALDTLK